VGPGCSAAGVALTWACMALAQVRRALPFLTVAVLLGLLYDGWIFYSRWDDSRQAEQKRTQKEAQDARQTLDRIGGDQLKILNFYASPGLIQRGREANVCYSVVNAKTLRMEPPDGDVYPALSHCFQISPRKTTEYKLIAADDAGHTVTQNLTLEVKP
jgi:hypothetical protein